MKKLWSVFLMLALCIGMIPAAQGEGVKLAALREALESAQSVNDKLAMLYETSIAGADVFETGGWEARLDLNITVDIAEWLFTEEEYEAAEYISDNRLPEQFAGKKLLPICALEELSEANRTYSLAGDLYVRMPEEMRAQTVDEADGVTILRMHPVKRTDYIGEAYNRYYDLYVKLFDEDSVYKVFSYCSEPPQMGMGTLAGNPLTMEELWSHLISIFCTNELTYPYSGGKLCFRVTGKGCCWSGAGLIDGDVIEVPAEVEGYPVLGVIDGEYSVFVSDIREVSLPEGIVYMGHRAFYNLTSLESINFPSTLRRIGTEAFGGKDASRSPQLTELLFNDALEHIGWKAFTCPNVRKLVLPSGIRDYGGSYRINASKLPYLVFPEGTESIGDSFVSGLNGECLYVPQSVTKDVGVPGDGHAIIYTPEGGYMAQLAEQKGYAWIACESADDMPKPEYVLEGDFEYVIQNGEAHLVRYLGAGGDVVIPEQLGGCDVTRIRGRAFSYNSNILSIVFPESLKTLDPNSVLSCGTAQLYLSAMDILFLDGNEFLNGTYVIHAPAGSTAQQYAQENGYAWVEWQR